MHPEFWFGLFYGSLGVGALWSAYELWRSNARVRAWLASEQRRIDAETAAGVTPCENCKGEDGGALTGWTCTDCGRVVPAGVQEVSRG